MKSMSALLYYNAAFLFVCCITPVSSVDVFATRRTVSFSPTPIGSVLCPGQPPDNYCDCDGDCTEQPEWCRCGEAKECCGNSSGVLPPMDFLFLFSDNEGETDDDDDDDVVLCPGQPPENYCDCGGDCTGNPGFCACGEAEACCAGATPVVLCPDQPEQNYCDCTGDCTEEPQWCDCDDAQKCCQEYSERKNDPFSL